MSDENHRRVGVFRRTLREPLQYWCRYLVDADPIPITKQEYDKYTTMGDVSETEYWQKVSAFWHSINNRKELPDVR